MQLNYFVPQGVEDIHCDEFAVKEYTIANIKNIFKSFGYRQILTPTFEYYDLFTGVEGTIDKDKMLKFIDTDGKILVLRPDATTPIARMVATNYKSASGYLKFSYATSIFRINDEQSNSKREFIQAGIEYLGNETAEADAEVISLAIKSLINSGLKDFQIDLGHIGYFKGLITELGISSKEHKQIRRLIENKNFAGLRSLLEQLNVGDDLKKNIIELPYLYGKPEIVLANAEQLAFNVEMKNALENLKNVYNILCDYGYEQYISLDLGIINHIKYYTGVIFKGYVNNFGKTILSGGRYDKLTKEFGHYMPATGFGLNINELLEAMKINKINENLGCYTDYLILYKEEDRKNGLLLADKLRANGFIVESDLNDNEPKKYFQNAKYRKISKIVQLNGKELKIIDILNDKIYTKLFIDFFE